MAKKFLIAVDLAKNELQNARVQNLGAPPGSPVDGQIYFDTALDQFGVKTAGGWVYLPNTEVIQDLVGAMVGGSEAGLTVTYDDGTGTLTFALDDEYLQDVIGAMVSGNTESGITVTYDDTGAKINFTVTDSPLLQGQNSAFHLARGNHTGNQPASSISDFDAQVRTSRLDQMAAPTAAVSMNGQKVTNGADPTAPGDLATKSYVDALGAGAIDPKDSVRVATTAALPANTRVGNIITATGVGALPDQDGVSLAVGNRILVKNEADAEDNGIYTVTDLGSAVTPFVLTRASDADSSAEVTAGMYMWVTEGTTNGDTAWILTTNDPITLNTTPLTFVQFTGLGQVTAGAGLTKTGNTIDAVAGTGIIVNPDSIAIDPDVVARKASGDIGDAAATQIDFVHSLNTRDVVVQIRENATPWAQVECDVEMLDVNTVRLRFAVAPAEDEFRVTVLA